MKHLIVAALTASTFFAAVPVTAQEDVLDKIRQLELQIQQLKLLKEQQSISAVKTDDCMKVFSREKYCSCVGSNLPKDISFEQYVHLVLTPRDIPGGTILPADSKSLINTATDVRDKCVEKGFFK